MAYEQHSAYEAPAGFEKESLAKQGKTKDFVQPEFVAHQQNGKQVWLVRIPDDVDPKLLDGVTVKVDLEAAKSTTSTEHVTKTSTDNNPDAEAEDLALIGWNVTNETLHRKALVTIPEVGRGDKLAMYDITNESRRLGSSIAAYKPLVKSKDSTGYTILTDFQFDKLVSLEDLDELHA